MKCLVIQTAYLGDVILTMPLLRLLGGLPDVRSVTVLATPVGAELLRGQEAADRIMIYDKRGADRGAAGFRRVVSDVGRCAFDVAVIPHRSFRSALIPLLALVPERIGFDESGGRAFLTRRVTYRERPHEIERMATLAGPVGAEVPEGRLEFRLAVPEAGRAELIERLSEAGVGADERLVVAAPGSRWPTKRWAPERFGAALSALGDELDMRPVVTGSRAEVESGSAAAGAAGPAAVDLTGRLSVPGLLALAARAELLLSNDSAAAHVAAGVGTPVVAVFGPTDPAQGFAPYSDSARVVEAALGCRPCGRHGAERCSAGTLECMERIGVEDVVAAARSAIGAS